jgi:hypothetical protein
VNGNEGKKFYDYFDFINCKNPEKADRKRFKTG